jgi:hypothetical protein
LVLGVILLLYTVRVDLSGCLNLTGLKNSHFCVIANAC